MHPKPTRYRNKKILAAANGQACTVQSPACNGNPATVVAAHSDYAEDGKGMGQKADDCFVAFACSGCHHWLHEGKEGDRYRAWHRGFKRTLRTLLDTGVLK